MYNTGHPQRRPGGVSTPISPESQFNFDAAPISPHTTYHQPQIPMENPQVPVIESGSSPTVHDDPLIPTGSPHFAPQTHSGPLQNYNDGGYVQYPNPQGYMMRGAPTSSQAGAIKYQESSERAPLTATKCRKAAEQFKKETSLTDNLTCDEDDLDNELHNRQNQMGFGRGSEMRKGLRWRSTNFVAFVCHLAFKVAGRKQNQLNQNSSLEGQTASGSATGIGQPPQKKRRTTKTTKQPVKTVWDVPPSIMHKRPPKSSKKPVATRPFFLMVDPKWQEAHPSLRPLTPNPHVQEPTWLANFYDEVKEVVESGDEADEQDVDADVEDEGNPGADEEASEGDVE
ncbi:hypothetical protein EV363DRAFT_1450203 [Boletus edulis]|nr:hypothetical protein EV363DRAFT_1450203 [Boletus edulis]